MPVLDSRHTDVIVLRTPDSYEQPWLKERAIAMSLVFKTILTGSVDEANAAMAAAGIVKAGEHDGSPVLSIPEDGRTLVDLINAMSPKAEVRLDSSDSWVRLLVASTKYQMQSVLEKLREFGAGLSGRKLLDVQNAFAIYDIAYRNGWKEQAHYAARVLLGEGLSLQLFGRHLPYASGAAIYALVTFASKCRDAIVADLGRTQYWRVSTFAATQWLSIYARTKVWCMDVHSIHKPEILAPTGWLTRYFREIFCTAQDNGFIGFQEARSRHVMKSRCKFCKAMSDDELKAIYEELKALTRMATVSASHRVSLIMDSPSPPSSLPQYAIAQAWRPQCEDTPTDLVIRSTDFVDFRVHQSLLWIASPVFQSLLLSTLYSLPPPPSNGCKIEPPSPEGLLVVSVPEDAETLASVLDLVYPRGPSLPDSFQKAAPVLAACLKLRMDSAAALFRTLLQRLRPTLISKDNVFESYAVARRYHLQPEMQRAASLSLHSPMTLSAVLPAGADEADRAARMMAGADLYGLWRYRERCRANLCEYLSECAESRGSTCRLWLTWLTPEGSPECCADKSAVFDGHTVPEWWTTHFRGWARRLAQEGSAILPAFESDAFDRDVQDHISEAHCRSCSAAVVSPTRQRFFHTVREDIQAIVEEAQPLLIANWREASLHANFQ
ncbi:hypothetical protein BV25DRAFT_1819034 [Artomyces pyxidatus]|uniref:Uncharacterized protein n=1 Tax=Artomyces pyxidatus TaxID=48021 RepID=A0ACB8TGX0_9AGAM|nr:hypothetical protein BV25DRAFT_1819034 [Artomyces pyxidatus]